MCSTEAVQPDTLAFASSLPDYEDTLFDEEEQVGGDIRARERPHMFRVPIKPQYLKRQALVKHYLQHKKSYHAYPVHLHMKEGAFHSRRSLLSENQLQIFPEHAHRRFLYIPVDVNDLLKVGNEQSVGEAPSNFSKKQKA